MTLTDSQKKAAMVLFTKGLDPEKQDAISAFGENVLVSAGAGCGKTMALSKRVLFQVMMKGLSVSDMLILTFTNNAAAEMRERIGAVLKATAEDASLTFLTEQNRNDLLAESEKAQTAQIQTFDSYANGLVRKNAASLGISSDFVLLDDAVGRYVFDKALRETITEAFEDPQSGIQAFLDKRTDMDEGNLVSAIRAIEDFRQALVDPTDFLAHWKETYLKPETVNRAYGPILDRAIQALERLGKAFAVFLAGYPFPVPENGNDFLNRVPGKIQEMVREGKTLPKNESGLSQFKTLLAQIDFKGSKKGEPYDPSFKILKPSGIRWVSQAYPEKGNSAKTILEALRKKYEAIQDGLGSVLPAPLALELQARQAQDIDFLLKLDEAVHRKVTFFKTEKGAFTFDDISLLAMKALSLPDVREAERSRCLSIMVDEYQDTSDRQEAMLRILGTSEGNYQRFLATGDVSLCFDRNVVFMVGDVKQSIYGFRNARPELFMGKYQNPAKHRVRVIAMKNNYRSSRLVTREVNDVFSKVMTPECGGVDYNDGKQDIVSANPKRQAIQASDLLGVDSLRLDAAALREAKIYGRDLKQIAMAKTVATSIQSILASHSLIETRKGPIPLSYGSFAVLLRHNRDADAFVKAFADAKIPFALEIDQTLSDTDAYKAIKNLFRLISLVVRLDRHEAFDATQRYFFAYSLASVERSFLVNVPDWQLVEDEKWFFDRKRPVPLAVQWIREGLSGWDPKDLSLIQAVTLAMAPFRPLAKIVTLPDPQSELTSYEWMMGTVRGLSGFGFGLDDLADFYRIYARAKTLDDSQSREKVAKVSADAVTITSIHKSKGLEYDFCYLPIDRVRRSKRDSSPICCSLDFGFSLPFSLDDLAFLEKKVPLDPKGKEWDSQTGDCPYADPFRECLTDQQALKDASEELRVFYVAMTRSKIKNLFVETLDSHNAMEPFLPWLGNGNGGIDILAKAGTPVGFSQADVSGFNADALQHLAKPKARTPIPPQKGGAGLVLNPPLPSPLFAPNRLSPQKPSEGAVKIADYRAEAFGTLLHKELETLDWSEFPSELPDTSFIENPKERKLVDAFVRSRLIEGLKAQPHDIFQEYGFVQGKTKGSIDFLAVGSHSAVVVDYKTSGVTDPAYLRQLGAYRDAVSELFGLPKSAISCYLFSLAKAEVVDLTEKIPAESPKK